MTRRPTIIDVARLARVSKATVGRVVSGQDDLVREETRARVMEAVTQLGYERNAVAGSLRTDKTYMIALSIPDIANPFWSEVARGVQDTSDAHDYATVTVNTDWDAERETKYLKMVRRNRFDGLIINPTNAANADFKEMRIPVVMLGSGDGYPSYDRVGSDSAQGAQAALEHLYELGHRRIGLIAGRSTRKKTSLRYPSYVEFHAKKHLKLDEQLVIYCEFSLQAGAEAMRCLMNLHPRPTAVFAANDILAIGALQTAHAMRLKIPHDVSIIGMDDIYAASATSPLLTTIAKPKYDIGVQAAKLLLARIQSSDQPKAQDVKLPCRLVERESTGPPRL